MWAVGVRFFIQLSQLRTLSSLAHAENMVALGIRTTPIEIDFDVWSGCIQCNCSTSMPELVDFECADDCQGLLSAVYICLHDISMIFPWFHTLIPWACHLVVSSNLGNSAPKVPAQMPQTTGPRNLQQPWLVGGWAIPHKQMQESVGIEIPQVRWKVTPCNTYFKPPSSGSTYCSSSSNLLARKKTTLQTSTDMLFWVSKKMPDLLGWDSTGHAPVVPGDKKFSIPGAMADSCIARGMLRDTQWAWPKTSIKIKDSNLWPFWINNLVILS